VIFGGAISRAAWTSVDDDLLPIFQLDDINQNWEFPFFPLTPLIEKQGYFEIREYPRDDGPN
jgi:hypothetical protein